MLLAWLFHMLDEKRLDSVFLQPPCTSFSAAAHPACRSYVCPTGWDRMLPKVWRGNLLAFRCLLVMFYCLRLGIPAALEQPRLSKMAWLAAWRWLLRIGCEEAIVASCAFQSIHKKEFRLLLSRLHPEWLEQRCRGGHQHVRIEGRYTKDSAIYTKALARHFARAFGEPLRSRGERERWVLHMGFIRCLWMTCWRQEDGRLRGPGFGKKECTSTSSRPGWFCHFSSRGWDKKRYQEG